MTDCAWCGGECDTPFANKRGEVFCSRSHRAASGRALLRLQARDTATIMPDSSGTVTRDELRAITDSMARYIPPSRNPNLASIRVLYRDADHMTLWGIPYELRQGQQPRDIRKDMRGAWIYLGTPGWFYGSTADAEVVQSWLTEHATDVPCGPYEWCRVQSKEIATGVQNLARDEQDGE